MYLDRSCRRTTLTLIEAGNLLNNLSPDNVLKYLPLRMRVGKVGEKDILPFVWH